MDTPAVPTPHRLRDGFRHRGKEVTRLEVFVDAAFAFAVTLLVISIDTIPDSVDDLIQALKGAPAFGLSLVMIALFWSAHARWSRRYGLDDALTTVVSMAFVFFVLLYVYPLKMLFATFCGWISGGWLPMGVRIAGANDILRMFALYAAAFVSLSLCLASLYANAWRQRDALALDAFERERTLGEMAAFLYFAMIGLLSLLLALGLPDDSPPWVTSLPGMVYFLLSFTGVVETLARRCLRQRDRTGVS